MGQNTHVETYNHSSLRPAHAESHERYEMQEEL